MGGKNQDEGYLGSLRLPQTSCVRKRICRNQSRRACPELVERGRLNLAQDAVPGTSGNVPESRRDG
jgi:hypothetical protein